MHVTASQRNGTALLGAMAIVSAIILLRQEENAAPEGARDPEVRYGTHPNAELSGQPVFISSLIRQNMWLELDDPEQPGMILPGEIGTPGGLPRKIVVDRRERPEEEGELYEWSTAYFTSFNVLEFQSRTYNDLFVRGVEDGGGQVVERWTLHDPDGAISVLRPPATTPIGTPFVTTPPEVYVKGGAFVDPSSRGPVLLRRKVIIDLGSGQPAIREMEPDPDGRFVLYLDETNTLHRKGLGNLAPDGVVTTSAEEPYLETCDAMYPVDVPGVGRVWIFEDNQAPISRSFLEWKLVFVDQDNDGYFETMGLRTLAEAQSLLAGASDDFVDYL